MYSIVEYCDRSSGGKFVAEMFVYCGGNELRDKQNGHVQSFPRMST